MTTQRVFRLPQRTSIHDLQVSNEEIPSPTSQEVLIRIKSVALNFRDFAVSTGKYPFPVKDNVVPGSDLSGEVVSIGDRVEGFSKGDKVIASFDLNTLYGPIQDWHHSLGGCYDGVLREFIALPTTAVVKIPADSKLSFAQLSALVCTGTTAWNALYGNMPLKPGQTVLFLGRCYSSPQPIRAKGMLTANRHWWRFYHWTHFSQSSGCNNHHNLLVRLQIGAGAEDLRC
jgi:NADPH:quinone reductase-like Zn-dependent oxidoreductase